MLRNSLFADHRPINFTSVLVLSAICASSLAFGAEQQLEEIHTHAERPAETIIDWSMTGQPIKKAELRYDVRYNDLDLTSSDGVKALRKRVTHAALRACSDLGRRYASLGPGSSCSAAARRSAKLQVDHAIAQAQAIVAGRNAALQADRAIAQKGTAK